ncbi:terminase small subunit [Escherichia coli]|nr:terminase small subunit [Escherichia coli]EFL7489265.1 terminase small subunit [Escherichia coli]
MEVNKKQLADIFGASIRTIQNWQEQGMPVLRGGGKGNEVLYDSAAVIKWYAERDAEIENEKLRREVEELRQASEADLQPGTIEYERHRLTRAQADAQELKNARDSAEVVETAFCTFVLSRIAGEIASILDGIPLSVQRRFPELENRHVDFLKRDIIKAMNKAAALDELIPGLLSEYMRGWTIKGKPASGRAVLSQEQDGIKSHTHSASASSTDLGTKTTSSFDYGTKSTNNTGAHTHSISGTANSAGAHQHKSSGAFGGTNTSIFPNGYTAISNPSAGIMSTTSGSGQTRNAGKTSSDGAHTHSLSGTAASAGAHAHTVGIGAHTHSVAIGSHGHTITVNAAGNAENTVKNIAFNYIVRLA